MPGDRPLAPVSLSPHPTQITPPPLGMTDPQSFAYHTLTQRWPQVIAQVQRDRAWSASTQQRLDTLKTDLQGGVVHLWPEASGDRAQWQNWLAPWLGQPWITVPWFIAETYFYRQILAATDYFGAGEDGGVDPFQSQKHAALRQAIAPIRFLSGRLQEWQETARHSPLPWAEALMMELLYSALWGNQADLSLQPGMPLNLTLNTPALTRNLLVNDAAVVLADLRVSDRDRLDIITDNAGLELGTDLLFAYALLASGRLGRVTLHLKAHPTFVSDATIADVEHTLQTWLSTDPQHPDQDPLTAIAWEIQAYRDRGQIQCQAHPFWTSPLAMWDLPTELRTELAQARWVLLKGDANYRRLAGDRPWDFTLPLAAIAADFPTHLVALRTLKSPLILGLQADQIEQLDEQDATWLTAGRWGVIQAVRRDQNPAAIDGDL